ncbi:MAG: hypothetical protein HYR81_06140 [Nitrospirae bacterium]|nr:hypothetical protein [Nitrospirota bacterium]
MKNIILSIIVLSLSLSGCGGGGRIGAGSPAQASSGVTAAQVAGIWKTAEFVVVSGTNQELCSGAVAGTMTLNANGTYTASYPQTTLFCIKFSIVSTSTYTAFSATGTFQVNADGSGTIISQSGGVSNFQVSKDLNSAIFSGTSSVGSAQGTALRM